MLLPVWFSIRSGCFCKLLIIKIFYRFFGLIFFRLLSINDGLDRVYAWGSHNLVPEITPIYLPKVQIKGNLSPALEGLQNGFEAAQRILSRVRV